MAIRNGVGLSLLALLAVVPAQAAPTFTVTSPAQNASVPSGTVVVQFAATGGFALGDQGQTHLHMYLDADPVTYHFYNGSTKEVFWLGAHTHTIHWRSTTSIEIYGLNSAPHQVRFVLANGNHTELTNLEATKTLNFTVLAPVAARFSLQPVAIGLSFPVGMAFAPDGRLFYNEWGTGKIRVMDPGWSLRTLPLYQVTDLATGGSEQGMLGLALDPDFTNNHFVYVYYDASNPRRCRVLRLTEVNNVGTNPTYILDNLPEGDIHNSGSLNFGRDGKLYITTGDSTFANEAGLEPRTNPRSESQNPLAMNGKVLRINKDGTIPADNPTAGSLVWARGLRNTFGATFHPDTGDLWSTENGPETNDEINRLVRTGNYGWPVVLGIVNNPSYNDPIVTFTPTIAPTGIVALRPNTVYPPEYQHNLFFGNWKNGRIYRIILTGPGLTQLGSLSVAYNGGSGGLVAMTQGLDGFVYVSSSNSIYRMVYSGTQAPTAVSVSPSSGEGLAQTFSFTYTDPNGFADLPWAEMLISTSVSTSNGCYARYERNSNALFLRNDNATAWLGPVTPGGPNTLQNSQCILTAAGSSVLGSINDLTVNLALSFKLAFAGEKNVYMQAQDNGGQGTGWQLRGNWTVPTSGNPPPSAISVTPASGSGSGQTFSFVYSDPNGFADLVFVQQIINSSLNGINACYTHYVRETNALWLANDGGTTFSGPVTLGTSGILENSQCMVHAAGSSASGAGTNLTVNLALSFKLSFPGAKTIFMYATDTASQSSGWQARGTRTVTAGPAAMLVTPASGSGTAQTLSFLYWDPSGYVDLLWTQQLINLSFVGSGACYTHYLPGANAVFLAADNGTTWLGPLTVGSAGALENSQCVVSGAASSVAVSGNRLTLNLALVFKLPFSGPKNIYMQAQDNGAQTSGWQLRGAWTVSNSNLAPSAVSVTPSSGGGSGQAFSFAYSDPNGYADLGFVQQIINSTLIGVNACYTHYVRQDNAVFLAADNGTTWLGPLTVGSAGTLENSQCVVNGAGSSVGLSGNSLTLTLSLTFKPAFAGSKNLYMYAYDNGAQTSGWQLRGAWTVSGSNLAPSAVSVTPSSGGGSGQAFSFAYSDPDGYADLGFVQQIINSTLNGVNGCYTHYVRQDNAVFLAADNGTTWLGPLTVGSAGTLENSQCVVNGAGSSVGLSGNSLTLTLSLTFKPAFAGSKNLYMYAYGNGAQTSGWQLRGTWTVP